MIAADDADRDEHTKAVDAATGKVLGRISINCANPKQRYVAPPADADPAGLKQCALSRAEWAQLVQTAATADCTL